MPTLRLRQDEDIGWLHGETKSASEALDILKGYRHSSFQHTWDVKMTSEFLEDYDKLDNIMKETVISAIAVLVNSKYPAMAGYEVGLNSSLVGYELGNEYRLVFFWHTLSHSITLYFVRTNDDVRSESGLLSLPDSTDDDDEWIQNTIQSGIDESYGVVSSVEGTRDQQV